MLVTLADVPPILAMLGGGVAAAALGLLLTPLLRLQGAYFGLASLAAAQALLHLIANPNLAPVTGGPYGVRLNLPYTPGLIYGIWGADLDVAAGETVVLLGSTAPARPRC